MMLNSLNFVKGAVAKKDFAPALTHFYIAEGFIKSFNGSLSLCSPIDLDIVATPKALPFVKAIEACKNTVSLNLTASNRLSIKSGKFKSFIKCTEEIFPEVTPEGEFFDITFSFLTTIKTISPFISEDASRPWSRGILFFKEYCYATNNICLIRHKLKGIFPKPVNIPHAAIKELLRINENPIKLQVDAKSVTFHFEGGRWLRTNLYSLNWPDLNEILNKQSNQQPFPEDFFEIIENLKPFLEENNKIYLNEGLISTSNTKNEGTLYECEGVIGCSIFNAKQMLLLKNVAVTIDFSSYPQPCIFEGDDIKGVIIGCRDIGTNA